MAKLFLRDKQIIGLDISTTGIKVMSVDVRKSSVNCYGAIDLDPAKLKESLEGNNEYLVTSLQTLFKSHLNGSLPSNHVALALPTAKTYSRTITLPSKVEKHLAEAIELEIEQYIPVPASTLSLDYAVIEKDKKQLTVLLSAIPRAIVDKAVDAIKQVGLNVLLVESEMSSAARLLQQNEDGALPTVIVDIGPATTDIAILDRGFIRVTSGLTVGGNTFTINIAKRMEVTLENAYQLKVLNGLNAGPRQAKIRSAVEGTLAQIATETKKVIRYYQERINDGRKLEQLLVIGSGSNMPGIGEFFTNELFMPARVANPWLQLDFGKLKEPSRQFRPKFIAVAGLSIIPREDIWK
jgi:type IV pilus assembly protein PilM